MPNSANSPTTNTKNAIVLTIILVILLYAHAIHPVILYCWYVIVETVELKKRP